jgi:hypothetical protein
MEDLFILIGVIVLLFIMWISLGGPSRYEADQKFINQELEVYDEEVILPAEVEKVRSRFQTE